jgi:peptidyl-prolyl cis-trans isomerase C
MLKSRKVKMKGLNRDTAKRFLREPLVGFMILGAALFALQAVLGEPEDGEYLRVEITAGEIEYLRATWARKRGRSPNDAELKEAVDRRVREEIYYREAVRIGLDQDDVIIRRRLTQKLEFMINNLTIPEEPPEAELREFFAKHAASYREPPRSSFTHVYFSIDRRSDAAADAEALLATLRADDAPSEQAAQHGDPFLHRTVHTDRSPDLVSKQFGADFTRALFGLEADGGWQGPLRSAYGLHLVYLTDKRASRDAELAEVRGEVTRDWRTTRRREANTSAFNRLRERYDVVVAELPSTASGESEVASTTP